ncbi:GxxExxY protein [Ferruginibacter sp. HRS2-29]|uniref:GxxExxY protein n=1 Tax=Ferruginibacter sp. HRS2-29 TaxID=2487334 RepID=UPI0020CCCEFD|nr:GxxExxY protein [Ferruginibacter sp. HRS2-29]MCP9751821.1 GxxExxY protein [Ferruginibacter sp. HRS2-29]
MTDILYKDEYYQIVGLCMRIHNELGHGFSEIVYKDALTIELLSNKIFFEREKEYLVHYFGVPLEHTFYADFVVMEKIILEIKCVKGLTDEHISQAINYLKVSDLKLAILINFGRDKLECKRILY